MTLPLITEGYLTLDPNLPGAPKKPLQTWYAIYGDLRSTNPETHTLPLVILHGGPGGGHSYLKRYAERLTMAGAPCSAVILYDSIGCGNSTPLNDMDNHDVAAFLTLSLHVYELDALIHHLGIQDAFHMVGHSYGGFLAAHYAATHQPPPRGLNRLILQSSPASFPLWDEAQMDLRRQLPPDIQDTIARCEAGHITADSTEFQQAITEFTRRHFCRVLDNPPQEFSDAIAIMVANPTVVETMYGTDKFRTLGTCKDWSTIPYLHNIMVPTLLLNGRYDTAQDKVLKPFFSRIPKVRWIQFAHSGHVAHLESESDRVIQVVAEFLTG